MEDDEICQVCFINNQPKSQTNPLLCCKQCRLLAHRYCYCPTQEVQFICDLCKAGQKEMCKICLNEGLLKKFGESFAHPLCLLYNSGAIVVNFSELTFMEIDSQKGRKLKCHECHNFTNNVLRCCSNCPKQSHYYCAMKKSLPDKGWKSVIQPLKNSRSYWEPYFNLLERTIRTKNSFLAGQLNIKKSLKTIDVGVKLYCEEHSDTIVECVCRNFEEGKIDWVFCDSCCRWEHQDCAGIKQEMSKTFELRELFMCEECKLWRKWLADTPPELPNSFPKMQVYDYIFLNVLLEKRREEASEDLVDFLLTFPLLPGTVYGELFYTKQLAKRLKNTIDLPFLKSNIQSLQENPQKLFGFMMRNRDRLELAKALVEGSIFHQEPIYNELEQNDIDPKFIESMLQMLIKYEVKFSVGKSRVFENAKRTLELDERKKRKLQNEEQTCGAETQMKGKVKVEFNEEQYIQEKQKIRSERESEIAKEMANKIEALMTQFEKDSTNSEPNLQILFENLHLIMKDPKVAVLVQELPTNLFTSSVLLFESAKVSAQFMEYVGAINSLQQQYEALKSNKWAMYSNFQEIKEVGADVAHLKQKIYYLDHNEMQRQLLKEIYQRQSENCLPSVYGYCKEANQQTERGQNCINSRNLKELKKVLRVKRICNSCPLKQNLACCVMQKLKQLSFDARTKIKVIKRIKILRDQKEDFESIALLLEDFLKIYGEAQRLLQKLDVELKPSECLFQQLLVVKISEAVKTKEKEEALFSYLHQLGNIKFSLFSVKIQQTLKIQVQAFLKCFQEGTLMLSTELKFSTVKVWIHRLKLDLPFLQGVIDTDRELSGKFTFAQLQFQLPQMIDNLEGKLNEVQPIYQKLPLPFRQKKVQLILHWIKVYRLIVNKLPLEVIVSPEERQLQEEKSKPSLFMLSRFANILEKIMFPEGHFKRRLNELVRKGEVLKKKYEQLMSACDWQFINGKSVANWAKKIPLEEFQKFMAQAAAIPIDMQVELLECQIIIQQFKDNENMAGLILADASCNLLSRKQGLGRVKEVLSHLGATPVYSKLTQKLLSLMENFEEPTQEEIEAEILYKKITRQKAPTDLSKVTSLQQIVQNPKYGRLAKIVSIPFLMELMSPIKECLEEYNQQISQFREGKIVFSGQQLIRIEQMASKSSKTYIFDITMKRLIYAFRTWQQLKFEQINLQNCLHESHSLIHLCKMLEFLHPCFIDAKVVAFRQKLQQLTSQGIENESGWTEK